MAANGISTLTIPTGITATSFNGGGASSYLVAVGTFNYDAYGVGTLSIRKDGSLLDAYINQVLALGPGVQRVYTSLLFDYGEAQISFTLNADGTFSNVTCPYGAGGYAASSGQILMPGNQLTGGSTPDNDILWNYVCAGNDGVITDFTYESGNPSGSKEWTFVPSNGQPSFTRLMKTPQTGVSNDGSDVATWNLSTANSLALAGTGAGQLNSALIPNGTAFVIYATELGGLPFVADKLARQIAKLNIAQAKRRGYTLNVDGTIASTVSAHLTTTSSQSYSDGALMATFRVLNRGGNWDEFFANWDNDTWSCDQFPGSVVTNMTNPGDDSPIITITGGTFVTGTFYSFTGDVLAAGTPDTTKPYYRARNAYSLTLLPDTYATSGDDNPNRAVGIPGIKKVTYVGFHDYNVAFTDTATVTDTTTATNFTIASIAEHTTVLYTGYLLATYTGTWTFTITSDDNSYLWIGSTAVTGYTISNYLAGYDGPATGTISLTAGEYYPIRVLYGNDVGPGTLTLTYAHTGQSATSNFTGKLFSPGVRLVEGRPWYDPNIEAFYDGELLEVSPGIWRTNYQNYYFENGNFFDTAALKTGGAAYNGPTSDISIPDLPEYTSIMLKGYMKVTYTGTYTFYLDCDDGAYMWFGDNAIDNWKDQEGALINYDINNGGEHGQQEISGTVNLTAGNYIPLRVAFGNNGGPGILIVSYSHTGQEKTSDFAGKIFYRTTTNGF